MEWRIIITGFYMMGLVVMTVSSLNSESTPQVQQAHSTEQHDSMKKAA